MHDDPPWSSSIDNSSTRGRRRRCHEHHSRQHPTDCRCHHGIHDPHHHIDAHRSLDHKVPSQRRTAMMPAMSAQWLHSEDLTDRRWRISRMGSGAQHGHARKGRRCADERRVVGARRASIMACSLSLFFPSSAAGLLGPFFFRKLSRGARIWDAGSSN